MRLRLAEKSSSWLVQVTARLVPAMVSWGPGRLVLWFALTLTLSVISAAAQPAHRQLPVHAEEIVLMVQQPEWAGDAVRFAPDRDAYRRLLRAGNARVVDFPLPSGEWVDLELVSSNVVHEGTRFFVRDADGITEAAGPEMRFFRGQVAGDPGSLVSLTMADDQIAGFVRRGDAEYTFGPPLDSRGRSNRSRGVGPDAGAGEGAGSPGRGKGNPRSLEVRDDAHETGPFGRCDHADALDGFSRPLESADSMGASVDGGTLLLAHVAVEGTVEWVSKHGGVAGAQVYTLNLLAQVSAIYENDFKVQLQVPYMLMHTAEDDGYTGSSNSTSTMLNEMRAKWNGDTALQNVFRTVAHLFSTFPNGGSGRAYLDVLCDGVPANSNSYDFGVSLIMGNGGSWERGLVAHELGHNFASPHTHCYQPEIDQCHSGESGCYNGGEVQTTGTIMSYCDSSLDVFHQRVIDENLRPAAESAHPACVDVAGMPGRVEAAGDNGLQIADANICPPTMLQDDDGSTNGAYGYSGSTQAAWVKRFTPTCFPFRLQSVMTQFSSTSSVSVGRAIRVLVYTDAAGTGNPVNATLVHGQDETIQVVGAGQWNDFQLTAPVTVTSGDYYLGFYDLDNDPGTTYIMDRDTAHSGDSYWQANGTSPGGFSAFSDGSWMVRGDGGGVADGSVMLSWGLPCNDASVPNQDFAIYQAPLGDWNNMTNLTCTTWNTRSWLIESPPANVYWVVVPQNSANEGSYGQTSTGDERLSAVAPCKPQAIADCQP